MIDHQYILFGGLPRAGSTLLANVLAQNPQIHATATSGCMDVVFGCRNGWDQLIEHQSNPDRDRNQKTKVRVLKAMLHAYHDDVERPVILEKCRGWLSLLEMAIELLEDDVKILVPIRNVADVLSSFEKLHRKQAATGQSLAERQNYFQFQTVEGRCQFWMRPDQPVGLAINRIQDAIRRGHRKRMHFVPFDRLTSDPKKTLAGIYRFLGMSQHDHDFGNIEQVTREDDRIHGMGPIHDIRPRIEPVESDWRMVLGPCGQQYSLINFGD